MIHLYVFAIRTFFVLLILFLSLSYVHKQKPNVVNGVIDRIEEDERAVILMEEERKEITLPIDELPNDTREGSWVKIKVTEKGDLILSIHEENTRDEFENSKRLREKLLKR